MKNYIAAILLPLVLCAGIRAQYVTIPDPNFVTYLQTNFGGCMSGNQLDTTCTQLTTLQVLNVSNKGISDLTGVQYFDALAYLDCSQNLLTSLPNLPQATIVSLRLDQNQLSALPTLPSSLTMLTAANNTLVTLPSLPATLTRLYVNNNPNLIMPPLPSGLEELSIEYCNYSTLPMLPSGLRRLFCGNNPLHTLPVLPPTLVALSFINIQLTTFPTIPATLTSLGFGFDSIGTYPGSLPVGLTSLTCFDAQMTALPPLPATLANLHCQNNLLTALPPIPSGMLLLECQNNLITSLPTLPNGLQQLNMDNNQLTSVYNLPPSLYSASFNNNQITCFGPFPLSMTLIVYAANNPFTCIPNYPVYMVPAIGTVPICTTGNPMGCTTGNGIGGTAYADGNGDCILNGTDMGIPNIPIKIYNTIGTFMQGGSSSASGAYFYPQALGNWTVQIDTAGMPYQVNCTHPGADTVVTLSLGADLATDVNFEVGCKPGFDVGVDAVGIYLVPIPGLPFTGIIFCGDLSARYGLHCAAGVAGQISVDVSGPATYVGPHLGARTPTVSGTTYTYTIADFGTVDWDSDFVLDFMMDTTATVGDSICFDVFVDPVNSDNNPANNTYSQCMPVRNSYDPNAKEVVPAEVPMHYEGWLTYTIHFQNTGNAPAFNIRLEDTLDANLDWATMEALAGSHYHTWALTANALAVYFPNIMLPDSATDFAGSQGWFMYRVKPKPNLPGGTVIPNTAAIYFDFNAPVITNTATTNFNLVTRTEDGMNPSALPSVYPNPSTAVFNVQFPTHWQGAEWTVTNLMGQELMHGTADDGHFVVDLAAYPAGYYLLQVATASEQAVRQLVKY